MIHGKLRSIDGAWCVEHSYPANTEPITITIRWRVTAMRREHVFAPDPIDGLDVRHPTGAGDYWSAFRQGAYLTINTEHDGTLSEAPFPCPIVRKGIETRYRYGKWEKCLKSKGWVPA